jgi:hypothetical protein
MYTKIYASYVLSTFIVFKKHFYTIMCKHPTRLNASKRHCILVEALIPPPLMIPPLSIAQLSLALSFSMVSILLMTHS